MFKRLTLVAVIHGSYLTAFSCCCSWCKSTPETKGQDVVDVSPPQEMVPPSEPTTATLIPPSTLQTAEVVTPLRSTRTREDGAPAEGLPTIEEQDLTPIDLSTAEFGGQIFEDDKATIKAPADAVSGWVIFAEDHGSVTEFKAQFITKQGGQFCKKGDRKTFTPSRFDATVEFMYEGKIQQALNAMAMLKFQIDMELGKIRDEFLSLGSDDDGQWAAFDPSTTFAPKVFDEGRLPTSLLKVRSIKNKLAELKNLNEFGTLSIESLRLYCKAKQMRFIANKTSDSNPKKTEAMELGLKAASNTNCIGAIRNLLEKMDQSASTLEATKVCITDAQSELDKAKAILPKIRIEDVGYQRVFRDHIAHELCHDDDLSGWVLIKEGDNGFKMQEVRKLDGELILTGDPEENSRSEMQSILDNAGYKFFKNEIDAALGKMNAVAAKIKEQFEPIQNEFRAIDESALTVDIALPTFTPENFDQSSLKFSTPTLFKVSSIKNKISEMRSLDRLGEWGIEGLKVYINVHNARRNNLYDYDAHGTRSLELAEDKLRNYNVDAELGLVIQKVSNAKTWWNDAEQNHKRHPAEAS